MKEAIYSRYGSIDSQDFSSINEAKDFLEQIEDSGDAYAIAVYDHETKTAYMVQNMDVIGKYPEDILRQKLDSIGLEPLKIESLL